MNIHNEAYYKIQFQNFTTIKVFTWFLLAWMYAVFQIPFLQVGQLVLGDVHQEQKCVTTYAIMLIIEAADPWCLSAYTCLLYTQRFIRGIEAGANDSKQQQVFLIWSQFLGIQSKTKTVLSYAKFFILLLLPLTPRVNNLIITGISYTTYFHCILLCYNYKEQWLYILKSMT